MIVLDASLVVELLTDGALADEIRLAIEKDSGSLLIPHLLDIEVLSALRNLAAGKRFDQNLCAELLAKLVKLPAQRLGHIPLLPRIWQLRHNFTAYDAAYIALAEATGATLFTCDRKLRKDHRARVKVFTAT